VIPPRHQHDWYLLTDAYTRQTIIIALTAILDNFEGCPTGLEDLSENDVKRALCALLKTTKEESK
jgi:hypothetical protein